MYEIGENMETGHRLRIVNADNHPSEYIQKEREGKKYIHRYNEHPAFARVRYVCTKSSLYRCLMNLALAWIIVATR